MLRKHLIPAITALCALHASATTTTDSMPPQSPPDTLPSYIQQPGTSAVSETAQRLTANAITELDESQKQELANALQHYRQRQFKQALPLLLKYQHIPSVQHALGRLYFYGDAIENGVERDMKLAAEFFARAAQSGYAKAQYALAYILREDYLGWNQWQDSVYQWQASAQWYQTAAANGYPPAQYMWAHIQSVGEGDAPLNILQGVHWYQAACDNKHPLACQALKGARKNADELLQQEIALSEKLLPALPAAAQQALATLPQLYQQRQFEQAEALLQPYAHLAPVSVLLGSFYSGKLGIKRDLPRAEQLLQQAAAENYVPAQEHLADFYQRYYLYSPDHQTKAIALYQAAAQQGSTEAQYQLARTYEGIDNDKAFEWYQTAADNQHLQAQLYLAYQYESGAYLTKNPFKAMEWYQKACDNQYQSACKIRLELQSQQQQRINDELAELEKYLNQPQLNGFDGKTFADLNENQRQQLTEALQSYRQMQFSRAKTELEPYQDIAPVAYLLGNMYYSGGTDIEQDIAAALRYFTQAADNHYPPANNLLGDFYQRGKHVEYNLAKAIEYYEKSAQRNNIEAQYQLARLYQVLDEKIADPEKSLAWYHTAAENNHVAAQKYLADLYYDGIRYIGDRLIGKNLSKALYWDQRACDNKDYPSCRNAEDLRKLLQRSASEDEGTLQTLLNAADSLPAAQQVELRTAVEHYRQQQFEAAKPLLEKFSNLGAANYLLGRMYQQGLGVDRDVQTADAYFSQASDQNDVLGIYNMAQRAYYEKDTDKAEELYKKAASEYNHLESQYYLAQLYQVKNDLPQAAEWFGKACDNGDTPSCNALRAIQQQQDKVINDNIRSFDNLIKGVSKYPFDGPAFADLNRAEQQELQRAIQLYQQRQFADALGLFEKYQRLALVQYLLAQHYNSFGTGEEVQTGFRLLQQAAEKRYPPAQYQLANAYYLGHVVAPNPQKAGQLLEQAAQDYPPAQYLFALKLEENNHLNEAAKYYRHAANNGLPEAQSHLARLYEYGIGVKADLEQAVYWQQKACDNGNTAACHALKIKSR